MKPSSSAYLRSFSWSFTVVTLGALTLSACGAAGDGSGTGGSNTGGSQSSTGGSSANTGGVNSGTGGVAVTGGTIGNGGSSAGSPATGGLPSAGTGGLAPATGGASSGGSVLGGQSSGGSAGSANGGTAGGGASGAAGSSGAGGSSAGAGGGGGGKGLACPTNATFCSGFEAAGLPTGAVYKLNGDPATPWTHDFEIDAAVHNSGNSSLRVKTNSESSGAYKMLAVPAPGAAFWARFYIRSDVELGAGDHNVYAQASGSDSPNDSISLEFAEDVGLAFNFRDDVRWPDGFGRLSGGGTKPFTLPKDTWHCIEISFDGQARAQKLFVNGMQQINVSAYPAETAAFTTFKFGYNALHGTVRKTWYDDVVVAPTAIGCL